MEEARLAVVCITGNEMEDILSVDGGTANERCLHFYISIFASKDGTVAIDSSPFRSVQAICVMQLLACRQSVGHQIGFVADTREFRSRSPLWHRLYLYVVKGSVVAHLQSAVDELAACRLLAMDGDGVVRTVQLQRLESSRQEWPLLVFSVVASHFERELSVDVSLSILVMEEPEAQVLNPAGIEIVDLEGAPYPDVAACP